MIHMAKATPQELKEFFGSGTGLKLVGEGPSATLVEVAHEKPGARELMDLKKVEGVAHGNAYDDLAGGIGDKSLTYPDQQVPAKAA